MMGRLSSSQIRKLHCLLFYISLVCQNHFPSLKIMKIKLDFATGRRLAALCRTMLDDSLPFLVGFFGVYFFLYIRDFLHDNSNNSKISNFNVGVEGPVNILSIGEGKRVYARYVSMRHFLPEEYFLKRDEDVLLSMNKSTSREESRPGVIWSWPEVEMKASTNKLVHVVTPTYKNPYQYAELMRVAQALYPARRFIRWYVINDHQKSAVNMVYIFHLRRFIKRFGLTFAVSNTNYLPSQKKVIFNPKGASARRQALKDIREKKKKYVGTVYFADDDNTYDSDIFRQMQNTAIVSIWPTGAITKWTVSSPIVSREGKVVEFFDAWVANRKFPVDFASFAFNASLLYQKKSENANIPWVQGYQETLFLRTLNVSKDDFQVLAEDATEVLTWHTKTFHYV